MKTVHNFGFHADPREISKLQWLHSRAAGFLVKNWEETWRIEVDESEEKKANLIIFNCYDLYLFTDNIL